MINDSFDRVRVDIVETYTLPELAARNGQLHHKTKRPKWSHLAAMVHHGWTAQEQSTGVPITMTDADYIDAIAEIDPSVSPKKQP